MYKLAVITDIHGDIHSLQDALKQIERMGCDKILCLGDIPDYGLFVTECFDELVALSKRMGDRFVAIRGNHCRWLSDKYEKSDTSGWERPDVDLTDEHLAWLRSLDIRWSDNIDGIRVAAFHASPKSDMDGIYPDQRKLSGLDDVLDRAEADALLVGHTHLTFAVPASGGRLVCNPGAVIRDPADAYKAPIAIWDKISQTFRLEENPRWPGTFGVLELPAKRFKVYRAATGDEIEIQRSLNWNSLTKDIKRVAV